MILFRYGLQDRLFYSLADELIRIKRIPGTISGIDYRIDRYIAKV